MTPSALSHSSSKPPVIFENDRSTRTFILNRPKLNPLDEEMIDLLSAKLKVRATPTRTDQRPTLIYVQEWDNAELCGMIIGRGSGRAFCAGGNVRGPALLVCSKVMLLIPLQALPRTPQAARHERAPSTSSRRSPYLPRAAPTLLLSLMRRFHLDFQTANLKTPYIAILDGITSNRHYSDGSAQN